MWAELISIFIGMVAIVITTIVMIKFRGAEAKVNIRPNSPKIRITALRITSFTNGYTSGQVKDQFKNKNGTTYISFYPDDVEQGETVARPDLQSFVVRNSFIKRGAEGDDHARRQTIIILPRSKIDMPNILRNTFEGEELTKAGQLAFIESIVGEREIAGDEALREMMEKWTRTGITKATSKEIDTAYKKLKSLNPIIQTPEQRTPTT